MAELWGSIVVSVCFWGLANRIMTGTEAKKYYPLFGLGANVALIVCGAYARFVSGLKDRLPPGVDAFGFTLKMLVAAVMLAGSIVMLSHRFIEKKVIPDPQCVDPGAVRKAKT